MNRTGLTICLYYLRITIEHSAVPLDKVANSWITTLWLFSDNNWSWLHNIINIHRQSSPRHFDCWNKWIFEFWILFLYFLIVVQKFHNLYDWIRLKINFTYIHTIHSIINCWWDIHEFGPHYKKAVSIDVMPAYITVYL